jgi:uncharacterized membrane protein YbhN (UPF0104 family)
MPYSLFKFVHVGSMFLATALAIGPAVLLYLIARNGSVDTIRRAFAHTTLVFRFGAAFYGLGLLFGFATALNGSIPVTAPWLIAAYVLILVLIAFNFTFERWTHRVEDAVSEGTDSAPPSVLRSATPSFALAGMITATLLIVFVMVVKPTF